MKKLSLVAIALFSTSALATDARTAAHQGNAGMADDTDYRTYLSRINNKGADSVWFDLGAGGTLSGAWRADGRSLTVAQNANGDATSWGYYAAHGDNGYAVQVDMRSIDQMSIGGGYGIGSGSGDMTIYGSADVSADEDVGMGISVGVRSREISKSDVTVWGAGLSKTDAGMDVGLNYGMGARFKTDRSKAAVTVGPDVGISMPEEGDMAVAINLAAVNVAGEFALNDWFGLRGSVAGGLLPSFNADGEVDLESSGFSTAFGASLDFEGVDLDLVIDPSSVLNGPYFLTGAKSEPAFHMSARFDI
jgi:hypothetical protein